VVSQRNLIANDAGNWKATQLTIGGCYGLRQRRIALVGRRTNSDHHSSYSFLALKELIEKTCMSYLATIARKKIA
jgi:hypothetical protein